MISKKMSDYAAQSLEELKKLIRELAVIPAPSGQEDLRAQYIKKYLFDRGITDVHIDDAKNVIWSVNDTGDNDIVVLMAHTDVVFPDTTPLPLVIEEDYYRCPGITDDVTPLCVLLTAALYFAENKLKPKTGLLIVANSCEEGLGNLKGSRKIVDTYGERIKELITFEAEGGYIVNRAVGSHRYEVTVKTEGGHSYGNFGNRNAIEYLSSMIEALYSVKVPDKPDTKTTYNVGLISGGTSVNTIAEEAKMLFEYRSDDYKCLETMKEAFFSVIEDYRAKGITVDIKLLGERPCGNTAEEKMRPLVSKAEKTIREILGKEPRYRSGSTDANYPLSKGIPAICIGGMSGAGCHTREEYLILSELEPEMRFIMDIINTYYEQE